MQRRDFVLLSLFLSAGCDSGTLWRDPPYVVHWIDNPDKVALNYDIGGGGSVGRVGPTVVAVGSNAAFVVAKESSGGYYYIEKSRDGKYLQSEAVVGPLTEEEFLDAQKRLRLPSLTQSFERRK